MRLQERRIRGPMQGDVGVAQGGQFGGLPPGIFPDQGRARLANIETDRRQFRQQSHLLAMGQAVDPGDDGLTRRLPGGPAILEPLSHDPVQGLDHASAHGIVSVAPDPFVPDRPDQPACGVDEAARAQVIAGVAPVRRAEAVDDHMTVRQPEGDGPIVGAMTRGRNVGPRSAVVKVAAQGCDNRMQGHGDLRSGQAA